MDLSTTPTRDRSQLRVGDAERAWTCDHLSAQFTLGRLSPADLDERLERSVHAVTRADLDALLDDLPDLPPIPVTPGATSTPQRSSLAGELLEVSLGVGAMGAFGIVALMILGSLLLGPGVFVFTLIGGSLTVFFTAVFTRAVCRGARTTPPAPPTAEPVEGLQPAH